VSKKGTVPSKTSDLYTSSWFLKAREYVESTRSPRFVLSAEHGLVSPDLILPPYEQTLNTMSAPERKAWAAGVKAHKGAVFGGSQGLVALGRGAGSRPLLVIAVPLKPQDTRVASDRSVSAVIFISDPDRADEPTVEALRRAFDLTFREAQTAIAIANGHGLKAAAKTMGVALTTVRSQLQQAFAKTGTSPLTQVRHDDIQPKEPH
jgi:DNA-binding CsgD family transcriptional regulator